MLDGVARDFFCDCRRKENDAVFVADHDVTGEHRDAATPDRNLGVGSEHAGITRRCRVAAREDRQVHVFHFGNVSHRSVGNDAGNTTHPQAGDKNVTKRTADIQTVRVGDQNMPCRHHLDRLALRVIRVGHCRAGREVFPHRNVAQRVGGSEYSRCVGINRADIGDRPGTESALHQLCSQARRCYFGKQRARLIGHLGLAHRQISFCSCIWMDRLRTGYL